MNTYEVLLQRDIGINKTVYVHDCYYEDEARLLAESQYGLPVLRVLYKGSSNNNTMNDVPEPYYGGTWLSTIGSGNSSITNILALPFGILIIILLIEFWWWFVAITCIGVGWRTYQYIKDD